MPLERAMRIDVPSANCREKSHFQVRTSERNPIFRCPPSRCPRLGPPEKQIYIGKRRCCGNHRGDFALLSSQTCFVSNLVACRVYSFAPFCTFALFAYLRLRFCVRSCLERLRLGISEKSSKIQGNLGHSS